MGLARAANLLLCQTTIALSAIAMPTYSTQQRLASCIPVTTTSSSELRLAHGAHAVLDFEGFTCDPNEGGAWMLELLSSTASRHSVQVVHKKLVQLPLEAEQSPPGFTAVWCVYFHCTAQCLEIPLFDVARSMSRRHSLLDESHMTAHCYSDRGWLAIDVFTCGGHDPKPLAAEICNAVTECWGAKCVQFQVHGRFLHESPAMEVR